MKRVTFALVFLAAFVMALPVAAQSYDRDAVVAVMRGNGARLGTIKSAIAAKDIVATAQQFFDFGKGAAEMAKMTPPNGSAEEWLRIWSAFQDAAFKGVGAAGERDFAKMQKALDEILALNKQGHGMFK